MGSLGSPTRIYAGQRVFLLMRNGVITGVRWGHLWGHLEQKSWSEVLFFRDKMGSLVGLILSPARHGVFDADTLYPAQWPVSVWCAGCEAVAVWPVEHPRA